MVFKCKICGGNLDVEQTSKVITCEYCGTKQTLPSLENDKVTNLYDRANHYRRNNEYDKAEALYEMILNENSKDAEAYWSLILCKYGVEYVEDPKTHEYIPTCNRTQKTSLLADENYKQALKYASDEQKELYKAEANKINEIQKGILEISSKEEPYDVFICYKEADDNGQRTEDSVIAQELYYQLQKEGIKAFFAKITLENKIGEQYEPYIYAALNSAKVMITIGTKKEYFEAPWVKNEWSRYLALIKEGQNKVIIPCFKNMDAYDLPEEFAYLQAQDMNKIGFEQDLIYGIKKIINSKKDKKKIKKPLVVAIVAVIIAIIIGVTVAFVSLNKKIENNKQIAEEEKSILKQDIAARGGYTFNVTVEELKNKILEKIDSDEYKEMTIEVREITAYEGYDGATCLAIGWVYDATETESEYVVGIEIYNQSNYISDGGYVSMVTCKPARYGSGDMSQLIIPENLYEEAKKILGSETEEWNELMKTGTIEESTYDIFTSEEIDPNERFQAGMAKSIYISGD